MGKGTGPKFRPMSGESRGREGSRVTNPKWWKLFDRKKVVKGEKVRMSAEKCLSVVVRNRWKLSNVWKSCSCFWPLRSCAPNMQSCGKIRHVFGDSYCAKYKQTNNGNNSTCLAHNYFSYTTRVHNIHNALSTKKTQKR